MRKQRAIECLTQVGLKQKIKEKVINLSGGERQRVAIARALSNDPTLILADEPTAALDSTNKKEIMEIFNKINKEGKTIIVVTHDQEVANYAKKILIIKDGMILEKLT